MNQPEHGCGARAARSARLAAMVAACGVAGSILSCSSPSGAPRVEAAAPTRASGASVGSESYADMRLRLMALATEADAPKAGGTKSIEPPRDLDVTKLARLSEAELAPDSPRMTRLRDVLAQLEGATGVGDVASAPVGEESVEAAKLYAQGRLALRAGNAAEAATALEAAARLSPDAPEVWRSLGEAQLALSRRASGLSSLRRAVALGLREAGTLYQLARESSKAGHAEEAAPLLARVLVDAGLDGASEGGVVEVDAKKIDPGLAMLVLIEASSALESMGRSRAAIEALEMGLAIPLGELSQTSYRDEVSEALRFRSAHWMTGGDLSMRLGDAGAARKMYEAAAQATMLDPAPLLARRVYASLLAGNSARAALAVLDDIERLRGRVDERQIELVSYVSRHGDCGAELARAIGALASESKGAVELTPTTRSRLAMAQAAALPADRAQGVLERALGRDPLDADLMGALVRSFPATDADELLAAAGRVVTQEPLAAITAANAMLADGRMAREVGDAGPRGLGATLVSSALLTKMGGEARALERVRPLADSADASAGTLAVAISIAMDAGDWDRATAWADALDATSGDEALRAKVFGMTAAMRTANARAAADALVAADGRARVRDLITTAEMMLSVGDAKGAEALVRRAMADDSYDERAYEAALQLHGPRGAAPSQAKWSQAGASLRQTIPASRLIRLIGAQELATRSLWKQAAEQAADLLEPDAESASALDLYVTSVERAADSEPALAREAEAMLRARVAARPQAPHLRIALARVLAAMDAGAQAEQVLMEGSALVGVRDLERARERVVRDSLADPTRADALTEARLAAAPKNIDGTLELAQFHTRKGRYSQAAASLRDGLPPGVRLPAAISGRLIAMVDGLTVEEVAKRSSDAATGALELLDAVASRPEVRLPEQLDATRVALVAQSDPTNVTRLLDTCADLARRHPRLGLPTYARVAEVLLKREDAAPALGFLRGASAVIEPASDALLFETYRLTVLRGTREDQLALLTAAPTVERLRLLLTAITQREPLQMTEEELRTEVLYLVANALSSVDKAPDAYAIYDEVLKRDPQHAWANNNYGYALLSREKDVARAAPMIETAYAQSPEEPSIIDSMGWLRYHQGRLETVVDEATGAETPGAVAILTTAADMADEDSAPEVNTHLGDAMWRAGQLKEAEQRWEIAAKVGRSRLAELDALRRQRANQGQANADDDRVESRYVTELRTLVEGVEARLSAMRNGQEPEVTPQLGVGGGEVP